jgi:hypothetical protein
VAHHHTARYVLRNQQVRLPARASLHGMLSLCLTSMLSLCLTACNPVRQCCRCACNPVRQCCRCAWRHPMQSRASLHLGCILSPPSLHVAPHNAPHRNVLPACTECCLLSQLSTLSPATWHSCVTAACWSACAGGAQAAYRRQAAFSRPAPHLSFYPCLDLCGNVEACRPAIRHHAQGSWCHEAACSHFRIQDLWVRMNLRWRDVLLVLTLYSC